MTVFDRYVTVDWSASSRPKTGRDSIWIADSHGDVLENHRTRHEAIEALYAQLTASVHRGQRVLVAWDFAFAYPIGTLAALGCATWQELWELLGELIEDGEDNTNNRFEIAAELNRRIGAAQPFWACPPRKASPHLTARRPLERVLPEYRLCEQWLLSRARRVHSPWKLFTSGSVGGQTLLGIPRLWALRHDPALAAHSAIWPMETGWTISAARPLIVHAETWPGGFTVDENRHRTRDAAQVICVVEHLQRADRDGELSPLLAPPLDERTRVIAESEEGWVLTDVR